MSKEKIMHEDIQEIDTQKNEEIEPPEKHEKIAHTEQKLVADIEVRISDLENQLKRVQAEFENYQKRTDKERQMLLSAGSAIMIEKLLPILDEMEIAVNAIHHEASIKEIKAGMEMLHKKFHSFLEKEGLQEMGSLGKTFDPYKHEAVKRVDGGEDDKIVEVLKKGYMYKGGVLRHAMVVVSKKPSQEKKPEEEPAEEKK